jgi:hypothetical protein
MRNAFQRTEEDTVGKGNVENGWEDEAEARYLYHTPRQEKNIDPG